MIYPIGCTRCARFCSDRSFPKAEEFIQWMVENQLGEESGDLAVLDTDMSPDRAGVSTALKCISCGQDFVMSAGKGPAIDAWGNRLSTWKVVIQPSARN